MPLSGLGSPHGPLWPPCKLRFLPSKPSGDGDDGDDDDDEEGGGPTFSLPHNKLSVNLGPPKSNVIFQRKYSNVTRCIHLFDGGAFMSSR